MKSVSWTSIQCIFYFHFARTNVIMIKIACNHLSWCVFMAFSRIPKFILLFCVQSQSSNIPCLSTPYFMPCLAARFYESRFLFSISRFCPCATNRLLPFLTFFPFFPFPYFFVFIPDEHFAGSVFAHLSTRSPVHSGVGQPLSYRSFFKIQSRFFSYRFLIPSCKHLPLPF